MITAFVQFPLPNTLSLDQVRQQFEKVAPNFREPAGLIRKYFLISDDGGTGGGVYLWRSRQDAEKFYEHGFRDMIEQRYGARPTITFFETPVVVDNKSGQIVTG